MFGVLAMVVLVIQLVTGIFLTMNYKPAAAEAFASVEYIMRDVEWGWLIRYMHSTGASFFFIVVYLHMFRAMLYGSYKKPRELIWLIGMMIFFVLMAEGFAGYLLPWGQMSYWGAQVIISLFGAIPGVGDALVEIIRGDYSISDITLNRFFALHVIVLPLALIGLIFVHIVALHEVGSNNPDGIDIKKYKDENGKPLDGVAFHPYHTSKDLVGIIVFLMIFSAVVFFAPDMGGYVPRARELRAGEHDGDTGAHCAGLVLHAVLRDSARRSRQTLGLHPVRVGRRVAGVPAVARSLSCALDSLPRLDVQDGIERICRNVHHAWMAGPAGRDSDLRSAGANFLSVLFRVLPAHAVLHGDGQDEAGTGQGGLP